jgi:predicted alpha/beta superfamily hydrolase
MRRAPLLLCPTLVLVIASFAAAQPVGRELTIDSKVLGERRVARVWVPAAYDTSQQRLPVLYLTDGDAQLFHTVATVQFLAREGRMPAMMVVGVSNTDRTRDLTPTRGTVGGANGQPGRPFPTSGGADRFLEFFATELIPLVERTYRTQPFRLFAGHSFGGLFATHAFLTRPDLFQAYIAVSPTLQWDDGLPLQRTRAFVAERAGTPLARHFVLTIGAEGRDADRAFDEMKAILGAHRLEGFEWAAYRYEDEDHGSLVMRSHYDGLKAIFADWRLPTGPDGTFTGTLDDVQRHYAKVSAFMGYDVKPPEQTVNLLGYQRLAQRRLDDALAFFRFNATTYSESANVHDSLGEALEAAGELERAFEMYEKAVQIGERRADPLLQAFKDHRDAARAKLGKKPSAP